jgi:hypothetical protein
MYGAIATTKILETSKPSRSLPFHQNIARTHADWTASSAKA